MEAKSITQVTTDKTLIPGKKNGQVRLRMFSQDHPKPIREKYHNGLRPTDSTQPPTKPVRAGFVVN